MNKVWPVIVSDDTMGKLGLIRAIVADSIKTTEKLGVDDVECMRNILNWYDAFLATCEDARP